MQATTAGKKTKHGDDEGINFRPSPNFKHMKKYLKSKFEEMSSATKMPETHVDQPKSTPVEEKPATPKQEKAKPPPPPPQQQPAVNPPLPPNPPPPDSPPPEIKQEVIDDEYTQYLDSAAAMGVIPEEVMPQYNTEMPQAAPKDPAAAKATMCRNYVRGTCTKGTACIFVHELVLDQLPGVYTFCRNFQNRQCTFARCKFVHATVFEKEYFYRTGYLPPHTLAHLKTQPTPPPPEEAQQQPPPPPPPAPQAQQSVMVQEIPQGYYPAYNMDPSAAQPMQMAEMNCAPTYMLQNPVTTVNEQHNIYGPSTSAGLSSSPLKRDWGMANTSMDDGSYVQQPEMQPEEPVVKKCKDCDSIEFRYQYNKNKVENMISSSDELTKKLNQLNTKTQRLCIVLVTLFKPQSQTPGLSGLNSLGEKDKAILEQLNVLLSTNNDAMPSLQDSAPKNPMNIQNLMTQLLMSNEQSLQMN